MAWQGHFFQKKARESDEESNKMILKPRLASFKMKFCGVFFLPPFTLVGHWLQFIGSNIDNFSFIGFHVRNAETQGDIVLDLHEGGAKEAIRLLKCHLSSFSGISCK